jgi:hypothetical protein
MMMSLCRYVILSEAKNLTPFGSTSVPLTPRTPHDKIKLAMAKTVKLDDTVHQQLEELRGKRETFSEAVARLVTFYRDVHKLVWSHSGEHPRTPGQGV